MRKDISSVLIFPTYSENGNKVFTHSLDVNLNALPFHDVCMCKIVLTVSQFNADVYLVYLVFQIS